MVLSREKIECLLQVKEQIMPQVKEFKYLGVLLMCEGRMKRGRQVDICTTAVMHSLHQSVVIKRVLSRKLRLLI